MKSILIFIIKIDTFVARSCQLTKVTAKTINNQQDLTYSQVGYRISFKENLSIFIRKGNCSKKLKMKLLKSVSPIIGKGVEIGLKDE